MSITAIQELCAKCHQPIEDATIYLMGRESIKAYHTHCAPKGHEPKPEPDWRAIAKRLGEALDNAVAYNNHFAEKQAALKAWRDAERGETNP